MTRTPVSLAAAMLTTLAIAGCGGDDNSGSSSASSNTTAAPTPTETTPASSGSSSGKLTIKADPSGALKFDTTTLQAKAGKVTIEMDNPSPLPHAVGIKGNGVDKDGKTVNQNEKSTATADLKAGTYTFYCPVDGHEAAGMKGTLTVK
jgi:plastocyanin